MRPKKLIEKLNWPASFLLIYIAFITATPAANVASGIVARFFLVIGVFGTLTLGMLKRLSQRNAQLTISSYSIVLHAPLIGILIAGVLPILLGSSYAPNKFASLMDIAVPVLTFLLVGYLAQKASDSSSPIDLLGKTVFFLVPAALIGISLTLAQITPLDVLDFLGLVPTNEIVKDEYDLGEVRFLGLLRTQGFFAHPLEYGATLLLAYSVIRVRRDIIRHRNTRWAVCLLLLVGMFFSSSRGIWLGIVLVELIVYYLRLPRPDKKKIILVASVLIIPAFSYLAFEAVASYMNDLRTGGALNESLVNRFEDYTVVFNAVLNHPLGVGYFSWLDYAESRGFGNERYVLDNDYLRFLVETGVLGFMAYILFVFRGLLVKPFSSVRYVRPLILILTVMYAYIAAFIDVFAFRTFMVVYIALFAIALRLESGDLRGGG